MAERREEGGKKGINRKWKGKGKKRHLRWLTQSDFSQQAQGGKKKGFWWGARVKEGERDKRGRRKKTRRRRAGM